MGIAIYGGTFDPFHKAHRRIVKRVLKAGIIDKLYVIPAGTPPHKGNRQVSFSTYRYRMAELALAGFSDVVVSDFEIRHVGRSFTIDTVRYFRDQVAHVDEEIYLVMGSDSLMQIETWREYRALLAEVTLLVARRPGETDLELQAQVSRLEKLYGARVHFFAMEPYELSSTEIREAIAAGKVDSVPVPRDVRSFIQTNRLYEADLLSGFSDEQIGILRSYERKLMNLVSVNRLVHSLNVMYEAIRIAERFPEIDVWKAAVAGILHDAAKELDYRKFPEVLARLDEETLANKPIIHGPVAASFVIDHFGVNDPAIRDAIYHHSSLSAVPSPLEKCIYLADKIEPARPFADLPAIRKMAKEDLDKAVVMTIDASIAGIKARGGNVHQDTLAARNYLKRKIAQRGA